MNHPIKQNENFHEVFRHYCGISPRSFVHVERIREEQAFGSAKTVGYRPVVGGLPPCKQPQINP